MAVRLQTVSMISWNLPTVTYNIIDWQTPFTWLWRWLPLRLSKRQSPTTLLFRTLTTLTRTITQYEQLHVCSYLKFKPLSFNLVSATYQVINKISLLTDEGIDTRIHGIKLISESEKEPGLNQDLFSSKELIRYMCVLTELNWNWPTSTVVMYSMVKFSFLKLKDITRISVVRRMYVLVSSMKG